MTQYIIRLTGDHERVLGIQHYTADTMEDVLRAANATILPYERSHKAKEIMIAVLMRPDPNADQWVLSAWRFATDRGWLYPPADPEIEEPAFR